MTKLCKTLLFNLLLVKGGVTFSQDQTKSEIELLPGILASDTIPKAKKARLIFQACMGGVHLHPERKVESIKQVLPIVTPYNEPLFYWMMHRAYLMALIDARKSVESAEYGLKMLEYAEKVKRNDWRYETHADLYKAYMQQEMFDQAMDHLKKARNIAKEINDLDKMAHSSYLIGYSYYTRNQNDSALYYLEEAMYFNNDMGLHHFNGEYLYLSGRTFLRNRQYDEGIVILDSLRRVFELEDDHHYYWYYYHAGAEMYMAHAYAFKKNIDSAHFWLDRAFKEYLQIDSNLYHTGLYYTGTTFTSAGYPSEGLQMLEYLSDSVGITDPEFYRQISKAYELTGKYKESNAYLRKALSGTDSLNDVRTSEISEVIQKSAESELVIQKQVDEEKQVAAELRAQSQEDQKNLILLGVALFSVMILFFGRMLYKRYKVIKAQKEEIHGQKMEVEEKNREILDSIVYAKRIQNAILPPDKYVKSILKDSFILYKPKDVVAGDFYWVTEKDNRVLFAAADCTGHGVPGAMVSVICNGGLNRAVNEFGFTDPGKILDKTRELVIKEFEKSEEEVKDGMDVALCSLNGEGLKSVAEGGSVVLQFAGAHNALWIIRSGADEIEEIKADKQPIGKYADEHPFTTHSLEINHGDTIYIFTDGFSDQFGGEKGKKLKAANFKRLLLKIKDQAMDVQCDFLDRTIEEWRGPLEQVDDICVIGVRV